MNLLDTLEPLRSVLLFSHLICCAFAITYVLHADLAITKADFSRQWLATTAGIISKWLVGLWVTGLAIIWVDTGFDLTELMARPKLLLKLMCVAVLTLNGLLLHYLCFPLLMRDSPLRTSHSLLLAVTGGLSTSHWLMAAFVGVAKPLGQVSFEFLSKTYFLTVSATVLIAALSTPVVRRLLTNWQLRESLRTLRSAAE